MSKISHIQSGSITSPKGFKASGIKCGLKASGSLDMALIFSEKDAVCAGAFTSNLFAAAPVQWCRNKLSTSPFAQAVIINSGNANACTGEQGYKNALEMAKHTAKFLNISHDHVFVASTGRIGVQMPMDKIRDGIESASKNLSAKGGHDSALAIMTTDTKPKETAVSFQIDGNTVTLAGMVKGAGMIAPSMNTHPHATMLCFITTDANVSPEFLSSALNDAVENSFNKISVDGDMSTNDTVIVLANGMSGTAMLKGNCEDSKMFADALKAVTSDLARKIVMDGEGATKFVTVEVNGASTLQDAKKCAMAIANSLLCKTAWFGGDPNWGRVIAAAGYSGASFDPDKVNLFYDREQVVRDGGDAGAKEQDLADIIRKKEFTVRLDLNSGAHGFTAWTSDISYEYVKINADYHT
ncbi:MAG TPA: ornithine acetyltransferase [Lentisphaeria bacterium]|nr:MAG: bifunctional ornithine acetyltransferase/N-acetylglutamate synthase [Lentisphaerae bacterium GWF2_38_69]HBM15403.1 ornithine acetyltransferase [Lentisphaeria bacterium]